MKCLACDAILTDFESSRRSTVTGDYIDLCNDCLVHVPTILKTTVENFLLFDPDRDDFGTSDQSAGDVPYKEPIDDDFNRNDSGED